MPIYTKSGDKGETGLIGGRRVPKDHPTICAIGELDELNAAIGVLVTFASGSHTKKALACVQNDIFLISAELTNPGQKGKERTEKRATKALENEIDALQGKLPPLKNFIRLGGTQFSAFAHLARTICRRAERSVCALKKQNPQILIYLNRLSDLLFVLARYDNFKHKRHGFY